MANYPISIRQVVKILLVDLKNIFRDSSLAFMFFVPLLLVFFLRLAIPLISELWPPLSEYYQMILGFFCLLAAVFPAFLISFLMLDEKDENLTVVFKVLPVYSNFIIIYRTFFLLVLGTLFCLVIILGNGLVSYGLKDAILLSLITGLISPIPVLLINSFANNKIEAVTWFKIINMMLMLPLVAFFVAPPWHYFFTIIPTYFIFQSFVEFNSIVYLAGVAYILLLIFISYQVFLRKS